MFTRHVELYFPSIGQGNGDIRLVGSSNTRSGRLEVYLNSQWGTVCDDNFGITEAQVVCQQLGYTGYLDYGTATSLG